MIKKRIPIPVNQLIERLRLMADSGGMLTKDRINVIEQAADKLEDLELEDFDKLVATMTEGRGDVNEIS